MTNKDRIEVLEAQMTNLTNAHRAFAARHDALVMVCRVMLPLIPAHVSLKQRLLTSAYDAQNEHMQNGQYDDDYQKAVRDAVDEITHTILVNTVVSK